MADIIHPREKLPPVVDTTNPPPPEHKPKTAIVVTGTGAIKDLVDKEGSNTRAEDVTKKIIENIGVDNSKMKIN